MRRGPRVTRMLVQVLPVVLVAAVLGATAPGEAAVSIDWVDLVRTLGFPAAVAVYVLWILHGTVKENTKAVGDLTVKLERLLDRLGGQ